LQVFILGDATIHSLLKIALGDQTMPWWVQGTTAAHVQILTRIFAYTVELRLSERLLSETLIIRTRL